MSRSCLPVPTGWFFVAGDQLELILVAAFEFLRSSTPVQREQPGFLDLARAAESVARDGGFAVGSQRSQQGSQVDRFGSPPAHWRKAVDVAPLLGVAPQTLGRRVKQGRLEGAVFGGTLWVAVEENSGEGQ